MLKLKVIKGPALDGKDYSLEDNNSIILGRGRDCEVRLPSFGVSKKHCRLTVLPSGHAEVEDLGSSNGTFVNGLLIKKKTLKPGDSLGVSDFILKLGLEAPKNAFNNAPNDSNEVDYITADTTDSEVHEKKEKPGVGQLSKKWLSTNLYPWLDRFSEKLDLRALFAFFMLLWAAVIVLVSINPVINKANERIEWSSIEVAKLYARQLALVNKKAIMENRIADLIPKLDLIPGQTPGILKSYILDAQNGRILSPAELAGNGIPNVFAAKALKQSKEWGEIDSTEGVAYVSAPIRLGTPSGPQTIAVAFVKFLPNGKKFQLANMLEHFVTSIIWILLLSMLLFLIFNYWINDSLEYVAQKISLAIQGKESEVTPPPVRWPALSSIVEQSNIAIARGRNEGGGLDLVDGADASSEWAISCAQNNYVASAAFDQELTVTAWNEAMESLMGIRAQFAVGSDISGASRDTGFETALRELAAQAQSQEWSPVFAQTDISGMPHQLFFLFGKGSFILQIMPEVDE